ncbi:uncharacterized protein METZ01_LOCUS70165, partial [marine metagenome]
SISIRAPFIQVLWVQPLLHNVRF